MAKRRPFVVVPHIPVGSIWIRTDGRTAGREVLIEDTRHSPYGPMIYVSHHTKCQEAMGEEYFLAHYRPQSDLGVTLG